MSTTKKFLLPVLFLSAIGTLMLFASHSANASTTQRRNVQVIDTSSSGDSDMHYIIDRTANFCVARFPHDDVVIPLPCAQITGGSQ